MSTKFNSEDMQQMTGRGMKPSEVEQQLKNYRNGFPPIVLAEPATSRHGIHKVTPRRTDELQEIYQEYAPKHKIVKFVPASGAASRMFKHLYEFRNTYRGTNEDQLLLLKDKGPDSVYYFFEHIREFAFFPDLLESLDKRGLDFDKILEESRYEKILNSLLTEKGLNYGSLPKALIPFHSYGKKIRTSFDEHLWEGAMYARSAKNSCHLHFTTLPDHLDMMKSHLEKIREELENKHQVTYHVEFSIQHPSTDMIAVDPDNNPVRDDKGALVFRPGGHGALLNNLAAINADLIIIKNIDNVCHGRCNEDTNRYKQVLAGKLIELQDQVFAFLRGLENPTPPSMKVIESIWSFLENRLHVIPPPASERWKKEEKIEYLKMKLNRPIRVCGMVENEGEPGGGPFWVNNSDGSTSLHIVESSQVNRSDPQQEAIFQNSTHFNPVDIVCSTRNYKGGKFNLNRYVDHNTGFISQKSLDGKTIKAQELPGLWNGSMSDWNTVFIEVPLTTFNPVKIINDLLRAEHLVHI